MIAATVSTGARPSTIWPPAGAVIVFSASATSSRSSSTTCPSSCMRAAATARPAGSATCSCRKAIAKFRKGLANPEDIDYLRDLSATIIETSRCGLGMTSPNPILSTLENFPLVYSAMVKPSEDGSARPSTSSRPSTARERLAKRRSHIFDKDFSQVSQDHSSTGSRSSASRPDDHGGRRRRGHLHPAALRSRGAAPPGRLPGLHGQGERAQRRGLHAAGAADLTVENETPHVTRLRRDLVEMLFHEGNHLCPICEASGNCELQAMAYRLDMTSRRVSLSGALPRVDASHPDIALDTNRCISCGRCIRASQDVDGKGVFGYVGRGIHRRVAVNGRRPRPYRREHRTDAPSRKRSARWAASFASASASRCRSANGNSTRA
jgi:ferredoxin